MDMINTAERVQDMEHGGIFWVVGIYMGEIIFVFLVFDF
jgi:hypothetical protein